MKKAFILIIMCIFLTGCSGKDSSNEELKQKTLTEIDYIGSKIITTINMVNNITLENYKVSSHSVQFKSEGSQSSSEKGEQGNSNSSSDKGKESQTQNNSQGQSEGEGTDNTVSVTEMTSNNVLTNNQEDLNWDVIKQEIELINDSWSVVVVDLYEQQVNAEQILAFSNNLDLSIISINNENKEETLINLAALYSYIPIYLEQVGAENSKQNVKKINSYVIKGYSVVDGENWLEVSNNLGEAEQYFLNLMQDTEYVSNNDYKLKKVYVEFKELQTSIINQDKSLFYVKYKNLMQSLNML